MAVRTLLRAQAAVALIAGLKSQRPISASKVYRNQDLQGSYRQRQPSDLPSHWQQRGWRIALDRWTCWQHDTHHRLAAEFARAAEHRVLPFQPQPGHTRSSMSVLPTESCSPTHRECRQTVHLKSCTQSLQALLERATNETSRSWDQLLSPHHLLTSNGAQGLCPLCNCIRWCLHWSEDRISTTTG